MSCVQVITVAWLFGSFSIVSSSIKETNRNVIVIQGVNDSGPINFTCLKHDTMKTMILKWKRDSKEIPECNSTKLERGEVCKKETNSQSVLFFGKIVKGRSDGTYRCEQWWKKSSNKPFKLIKKLTEEVSITVIKDANSTSSIPSASQQVSTTQDTVISSYRRTNTVSTTVSIQNSGKAAGPRNTTQAQTTRSVSTSVNINHTGTIQNPNITTLTGSWSTSFSPTPTTVATTVNASTSLSTTLTPTSFATTVSTSTVKAPDITTDVRTVIAISTSIVGALIMGVLLLLLIAYVFRRRKRRSRFTPLHNYGTRHWEFPRDKLRFEKEIGNGKGYFGAVHKVQAYNITVSEEWSTVAVKTIQVKEAKANGEFYVSLLNEARLLCDMGQNPHRNVVRLLGICSQKGPLMLIEEYAEHGDLKTYLRCINSSVSNGQPLYTTQLLEVKMSHFALQIARGMKFLVSRKIIHRDLAARNVLVFAGEILKICDFGLSRDVRFADYYRKKSRGGAIPIKWMSPEALKDKVFTEASDVWSYGVVLWEIGTLGGSPYPGIPNEQMYDLLEKEYRMSCPKTCPLCLYDIMLNCWEEKPSNRPTFAGIVKAAERMFPSNY